MLKMGSREKSSNYLADPGKKQTRNVSLEMEEVTKKQS